MAVYGTPRIKISPNSMAGCRECYKKIKKGTYRLSIEARSGGYPTTHYYHLDCYPRTSGSYVKHPQIASKQDISYPNGFDGLSKEDRNKYTNEMFKHHFMKYSRLKLVKEFNKMKMKDLKLELKRRDLKMSGKKQELKDRLEKFFNDKVSQNCHDILVYSYCKETEKKCKLNFPVYLARIVRKYYPPCA